MLAFGGGGDGQSLTCASRGQWDGEIEQGQGLDKLWGHVGQLAREPRPLGCFWGEAVRRVPGVWVLGGWRSE